MVSVGDDHQNDASVTYSFYWRIICSVILLAIKFWYRKHIILSSPEIQKRIDMDLRRRSTTGIIVYAVLLPAVFWPFDFHKLQPALVMAFASSMFAISLVRLLLWYITDTIYAYSAKLWRSCFIFFSLCHAFVLSSFFILSIYDERFAPLLHVTMLAIGGISSAALVSLTPRINFALTNLGVLLLPSVFVGLYIENKLPYAIMILVYMAFIAMMGIRASREYTRSFEIETQLYEQKKVLEQLNKVDALTGIYNRGYFDIEFENRWQYAKRNQIPETLILIDIDNFKAFNDVHGHLCGDACLQHFVSVVQRNTTRQTDVFARFGGEEFAILLTDCPPEQATKLAESIRRRIETSSFTYEGKSLSVTASMGIASRIPSKFDDKEDLVRSADLALYQAKKQGRNCVATAELI